MPTAPLWRAVMVTTPRLAVAVMGMSGVAEMAAAVAVAIAAASSPLVTPTSTARPAIIRRTVPEAVAGPVSVSVPAAATPAGLSASGRHCSSV
ncbi:hypothetical protein D9M68_777760 [compost metagenome]